MSHILFETPDGMKQRPYGRRQISGCEAAHARNLTYALADVPMSSTSSFEEIVAAALRNEPKARFVIRLCAQMEPGFWVRGENLPWFRDQLRSACENTVRVRAAGLGEWSEQLLRVASSNYGPADLNRVGDRSGGVQTWWSLHEWLDRGPIVAVSYSTTGRPWRRIVDAAESEIVRWFETEHSHMEWRPETWRQWSPVAERSEAGRRP